MKTFALTSLLASLPVTFALPDVVTEDLLYGCASYPGYDAETNVAGPWNMQTVNDENSAIESFRNTNVYSVSFNPGTDRRPSLRWGYMSPTPSASFLPQASIYATRLLSDTE